MKPLAMCLLALLVAACGNDAPPPQAAVPATSPPAQPLVAEARPQPAAAVAQVPRADPNAELAARVKRALEAASTEISQGVDVVVENGVVRLFGTVGSSKARGAAGKTAASTPGVTSVENKLVVVKGS